MPRSLFSVCDIKNAGTMRRNAILKKILLVFILFLFLRSIKSRKKRKQASVFQYLFTIVNFGCRFRAWGRTGA